ncbi:MAG: hypothetical protein IAG13_35805 [Deltaproteobacteria bacterium]|nr:hypothetical protein [Nannocystaceae bacterium]
MLPTRRRSVALPLSLMFFVTAATPACSKLEELTGKKSEDTTTKTEEAKTEEAKTAEAKVEEKQAVVEPIPVAPMLSGLDAMLAFVPDDKTEFVLLRDASVLAEYAEEGAKFLDGPLGALAAAGDMPGELAEAKVKMDEAKGKMAEIVTAIAASGLRPQEGIAAVKLAGGKSVVIFAADKPEAMVELAKKLGSEAEASTGKCKAIDGKTGWNVCGDDQASIDNYKPATDPAPIRTALAARLPGVDLDEANLLFHWGDNGKLATGSVATLPGLVHVAVVLPEGPEAAQVAGALAPGPATTMSQVQPGAGFMWARVNPTVVAGMAGSDMAGAAPEIANTMKSITGEFVIAGTVDPGGMFIQAGATDTSGVAALIAMADAKKAELPSTLPQIKDSKLLFEKTQVQGGGATVDAFHAAMSGFKEADILKAYAGLSLDAWTFAHDNKITFAVGPDAASIGKLLEGGVGGPRPETLASLPHQLSAGFTANEVSAAVHLPADFIQGAPLRKLIEAALKDVPDVKPAQVNAALSFLAPLSSATMWIAQPSGSKTPIVHFAVQGIGNRATDEGKAALEAARKVSAGGDPAVEFATLASTYGSSPMSFAYHTRAGDQGPGSLVGSGVGALMIGGAIGYATMTGKTSPTLADDLGVKAEDPPPPLEIPTKPVAPTHEPDPKKPVTPKKPAVDPKKPDPAKPVEPPKPDPAKPDPAKPDPAKPDPAKPDPSKPVEPPKPDPKTPPKPTPDPKKPTVDPKKPDPKKPVLDPRRPGVRPRGR